MASSTHVPKPGEHSRGHGSLPKSAVELTAASCTKGTPPKPLLALDNKVGGPAPQCGGAFPGSWRRGLGSKHQAVTLGGENTRTKARSGRRLTRANCSPQELQLISKAQARSKGGPPTAVPPQPRPPRPHLPPFPSPHTPKPPVHCLTEPLTSCLSPASSTASRTLGARVPSRHSKQEGK